MKSITTLVLGALLWATTLAQIPTRYSPGVGPAETSQPRAAERPRSAAEGAAGDSPGGTLSSTLYLPFVSVHASAHIPTVPVAHPTATPTTTATVSPTPTYSPTSTSSPTPTPTGTATPTATCTPTPSSTATPTATPTPIALVIGHITDAHIGFTYVYAQRLPLVLQAINQQAQVLVDTGDCTESGNLRETLQYKALLDEHASIPWRAVPGNHDTPWVFEQQIGPRHWSWDIAGYRLIGIDTEQVDYAFLDAALTRQKPCIVFGHFPLEACNPTDQMQLVQRFRAYHVPIYVAGHTHEDSLRVDYISGTVFLTGRPAGKGNYRLITIRGFEVQAIDFRSIF